MTNYKNIFGKPVKYLSSDPTDAGAEGQVWYNSTSGTFKTVVATETFAAGGSLNNARSWMGSAGNKNAAIVFGGSLNPYPSFTGLTEEYDGTGWASGATAPSPLSGIGSTGVGLQTAALNFGANGGAGYTNNSASYNGSTWTSTPNMNTTGRDRSGAGISTAALGMNSYVVGSQGVTNVEEYNGSSWTAITASGSARYEGMGFGVVTAAISCGGRKPPTNNLTSAEEYNGSSWTAIAALPQQTHKGQGGGTTTVGCVFGGVGSPYYPATPYLNNKVDYDGSTWAISPATMSNPRAYFGGDAATSSDIYAAGGQPSPFTANTEEFTTTIYSPIAAIWASGGALNTARNGMGTSGTQTAGLAAGGNTGPTKINNSEEYDGTSWTEGNNLNSARGELAAAGNSTQTASLVFGGTSSSAPDNPGITNASEEYNGTSWSSGNNMNYSARNLGGFGIQTSAVAAGGLIPTYLATTGEYDGTNWTAGTSLPSGLQDNQGMTGASQTSGLVAGGEGTPGAATSATLEYDGTTWTAGGNLAATVYGNAAAGIQTAALSFGGNSDKTATEGYDGTSWSSRPSLATGRNRLGGTGTNAAAIAVGGLTTPGTVLTNTEEFTGETFVLDYKTLTSS